MSMNIKNPHAHRLARELADATGLGLTAAVTLALEESLERRRRDAEARIQLLLDFGRRLAPTIPEPYRSTPHGELLYDELGLPK